MKRYDHLPSQQHPVQRLADQFNADERLWRSLVSERKLGDIVDGKMRLNEAGRLVQSVWNELPGRYPGVSTDAFIVMPNHIHGIIVLKPVGAGPRACQDKGQPQGVAPTRLTKDSRAIMRRSLGSHTGRMSIQQDLKGLSDGL